MASINVTINGVICDMYGRTITGPVKIVGEAMYSDLGVGGGPLPGGPGDGGGGSPPGIWGGGNVPMPTPPIANVPGAPGYRPPGSPPGIWGGGNVPMPTPPIANVPGLPPTTDPPGKPDVPPPTIWPPGPGIDFPAHPIVLPPDNPVIPPGTLVTWKAVWVPPEMTGGDGSWMVVGVPNVPHPSPS